MQMQLAMKLFKILKVYIQVIIDQLLHTLACSRLIGLICNNML